jgi:hypothetical protein
MFRDVYSRTSPRLRSAHVYAPRIRTSAINMRACGWGGDNFLRGKVNGCDMEVGIGSFQMLTCRTSASDMQSVMTHLFRLVALQSLDRRLPLLLDADDENVVGLGYEAVGLKGVILADR